jgi:hypothetical protein
MTGMTPVGGVLNHESTYKVIGDLMFCMMPEGYGLRYVCARVVYRPNGTVLGDVMTHQSINVTDDFEVKESTLTFLRVKENLNLDNKVYDYSSAYVTNAKGTDEDFTILNTTLNMAKIEANDFDMMFRSVLSCFEFDANLMTYKFRRDDGLEMEFDTRIAVDGNKA